MIPSSNIDSRIIEDWQNLGFYFEIDSRNLKWVFRGSRIGLLNLSKIILNFSKDKRFTKVFDHDHFGPYFMLKLQIYSEAIISNRAIMGTSQDLNRLGDLIEGKINASKPGDTFFIDKDFSTKNEYVIEMIVENDNFDPSSMDLLVKFENEKKHFSEKFFFVDHFLATCPEFASQLSNKFPKNKNKALKRSDNLEIDSFAEFLISSYFKRDFSSFSSVFDILETIISNQDPNALNSGIIRFIGYLRSRIERSIAFEKDFLRWAGPKTKKIWNEE